MKLKYKILNLKYLRLPIIEKKDNDSVNEKERLRIQNLVFDLIRERVYTMTLTERVDYLNLVMIRKNNNNYGSIKANNRIEQP
jgi:hypothetical protein